MGIKLNGIKKREKKVMVGAIVIFSLTALSMIGGILFFPRIRITKKFAIDSYWVIALIGLSLMLIFGLGNFKQIFSALTADTAVNPLKILVLFICMTVLSIFLDELGFFRTLALVTLKKAKTSQFKLFLYLYLIVSALTIFTSNDIVILSFTPFICYFAKNAKINPFPYLAAEFVGANTWSMMLIIGNPTNIYLATASGIDFISYLKIMVVPTIISGVTAFALLYIMFRKKLKEPIGGKDGQEANQENLPSYNVGIRKKNKPLLIIGIVHLAVCTILLAISSYIGLDMWLISLISAGSLILCALIFAIVTKQAPKELGLSLMRAPWQLIPFIISMFSMIIILSGHGITKGIADLLGSNQTVFGYGVTSFLACNIIDNIPMSVLFSSVINSAPAGIRLQAVFATIVGSNLGAIFTPIGALAGIMFSSILSRQGIKFGYLDFLKVGVVVALPTLAVTLASLLIFV